MYYGTLVGKPGIYTGFSATHKVVMLGSPDYWLPGGLTIDGSKSRDPGQATNDTGVLRPGLLLGKQTANSKLAPFLLGTSQNAYTSGGTSITVSAAEIAEINRRVGATGNLIYIGPPAASGVVAVLGPIAYSALNLSTGVITTATLGANLIAGGWVCANDGTQVPLTFVWDGWGIPVTDIEGNSRDVDMAKVPVGGPVRAASLIPWPSDTSLRDWLRDQLKKNGAYVLDYAYR